MTSELESVFRGLGLAQYLDTFVEQGFDTWDTILDIQESDLDALGVKLGHRRKLQRRIANARGVAPGTFLASPLKAGSDDGKGDGVRSESSRDVHNENGGVAKRKYRRHPKPDENAPERPPSAYVLFSNKMREDLKSQNLTFTEIAKLVGENWQNLAPAEKEAYESQANTAKERYHRDLVEYKKTPDYRRYAKYLQEFKEKQAKQTQAHEMSKRSKVEPVRLRHGSSSSSANTGGTTSNTSGNTSGSGSGSERLQGSEPPPTPRERMNSTASMAESHQSATMPSGLSHQTTLDEIGESAQASHMNGMPERYPQHVRQISAWRDQTGNGGIEAHTKKLPSLSDLIDDAHMGGPHPVPEGNPYGASFASNPPRPYPEPAGMARGIPPTFHHNHSTESSGSLSSATSFHHPSDGSLPIHTLIGGRGGPVATPPHMDNSSPSSISAISSPADNGPQSLPPRHVPRGYGFQSAPSAFENMRVERSGDGDVVMSAAESTPQTSHRSRESFDGMNALLQAGEIVGRRVRD